jgi:acyl-CoA thioester hydrolase
MHYEQLSVTETADHVERAGRMTAQSERSLDVYPARYTEQLRYRDTDRQGHINNAVYSTFCESGRTAFLSDPDNPFSPPGTNFVIVRLAIDFRRELHWPGAVQIGTGVLRIGTKSFTLEQGIFSGDKMVARAENVMAIMDDASRQAIPIPDTTRVRLEALMI